MKKIVSLVLAAVLLLSLAACGKSDAAKAADEQIAAIGTVTLSSEAQIAAAEAAVSALTEDEKKQLDNAETLQKARSDYDALVLAAEAQKVDDAIAAIGTVSLSSGDAVAAARSLYDGSAADVQALVKGLPDLEAAEEQLSTLRAEQVSGLIDAIGTVSLSSGDAVQAAQEAYDALSAEDAARVANAQVLEDAAAQLKSLKQAQGEALLAGMRLEDDKVRSLQFYYPSAWSFYSNGSWVADQRCFVLPYLGRDSSSVWLRLTCNYTGSDWVFFEHIIFAVDGTNYDKYLSYSDVVRDNSGGRVWEYVDLEVDDDDEAMLRAIADSTETIVRFEGDDYSQDFTIPASDKQAIRDVLDAYEALR